MPEPLIGLWASAAAMVLAGFGGWKGVGAVTRRWLTARARVKAIRADNEDFKTEVREGLKRVAAIEEQLGPNGGKSLGAKIDRVHDMARRIDARISATTNVMSTAIFETTATGEVNWVNRKSELLTGYSRAELLGRGWLAAVHPEDRARVDKEWQFAVKGSMIFESDFRIKHRAGAIAIKVHAEWMPCLDENDKVIGWGGAFHLPMVDPLQARVG